ncbi:MAG: type II secretion system protein [Phycisphaerales bacterium]
MSRARARAGFTLLELVIVVAMIGVLAALSVTSLARSSAEASIERAASDLTARLLLRRAEALKGGTPTPVEFRAEGATLELLPVRETASSHAWTLGRAEDTIALTTADSEKPGPSASFAFVPTGRATTREFTVRAQDSGDTIILIRFDPISGEPRSVPRPSDAAARDGTEQGGDP